ncbi:MAG: carbohydrate binding domain-containing protein [Anaerolineae bacterium]|nr:carbohydrate binding domain-containing protein [Phycisphaerae bacterium]
MRYIITLLALAALSQPATDSSDNLPDDQSLVANGDFENGINDWISKDAGMSEVKPEAAHRGELGLRVSDEDEQRGSSLGSRPAPATSGKTYLMRAWARVMSGKDASIHIQFFDANNKQLTKKEFNNDILVKLKGGDWKLYTLRGVAPENAATARVWIHTYNASKTILDVDDVTLHELK